MTSCGTLNGAGTDPNQFFVFGFREAELLGVGVGVAAAARLGKEELKKP